MKNYPQELKDRMVVRMLPPNSESVPDLSQKTHIPRETLYGWRSTALGRTSPLDKTVPNSTMSSDDKFSIVVETARLNEHELSEYCRIKGIYVHQVKTWLERCNEANAAGPSRAEQEQVREQAREIRQLRCDLQRKEKALAEAAALLMLQKKVHTIWSEDEGQRSTQQRGSK